MKKLFLIFLILSLVPAFLFSQTLSLDAAIQEAGKKIQGDLPGGAVAAVVNIESVSEALSDYIAGELTSYLVNGKKINMVSLLNVSTIEEEFALQYSGAVNEDSIQSIGGSLSADFVITGAFSEVAGSYRFRVQAVNASTMVIGSTAAFTVQGGPQITALTAPDANGIRPGRRPGENHTGMYRTGSYGPGGGIVFYDKGRESGGWRYLEIAPAETETTCVWGRGITGVQTSQAIGTGSRNTQFLAQVMTAKNLSDTAVLYCKNLDFGGFNDWFLPSTAELEQAYKSLKSKGIGAFAEAVYWSSSGGSQEMSGSFNFASGRQMQNDTSDTAKVRAVRAFK